ncbi:hypothetical protein [Escherichia coli]|uniref:hypothetical protein n=1 Tax=Escherichia coli TaxID=562 RepID=UPI000DD59576|nr:hypothetical protein [Escherichia coli]MDI4463453.1 hypothetical protein [Escherichia coli]
MKKTTRQTAQEQVSRLLIRCSSLLEKSDFVYGYFDDKQSRAIREYPLREKLLNKCISDFKGGHWEIEWLTTQDFCQKGKRKQIVDEILKTIGSSEQLSSFVTDSSLKKYPFLIPLLQATCLKRIKWPRGSSTAVSLFHNNREIDLVGLVLFLHEVMGYKQKAIFQFIAEHGKHRGWDSGFVDSGLLSKAAERIKKSFENLKPQWYELSFTEGSLQSEVRDVMRRKNSEHLVSFE